jgi:hypothetical protein
MMTMATAVVLTMVLGLVSVFVMAAAGLATGTLAVLDQTVAMPDLTLLDLTAVVLSAAVLPTVVLPVAVAVAAVDLLAMVLPVILFT